MSAAVQRTLLQYLLTGNIVRVEANGVIRHDAETWGGFDRGDTGSVNSQSEDKGDDADADAMRVQDITNLLEKLQENAVKMVETLGTTEEHKVFLQTLSRCVPTSRPAGDVVAASNSQQGATVVENIARLVEMTLCRRGHHPRLGPGATSLTSSMRPSRRRPLFVTAT